MITFTKRLILTLLAMILGLWVLGSEAMFGIFVVGMAFSVGGLKKGDRT